MPAARRLAPPWTTSIPISSTTPLTKRARLFPPQQRAAPLLGRGGSAVVAGKVTTPGLRSATAQSLASLSTILGESDGGVKGLSFQTCIQDHSQPHASATKLLIHDGQGFGLVTIGQSPAVRQLPIDHVHRNTIAFLCPGDGIALPTTADSGPA
jgi:hypothetical protein